MKAIHFNRMSGLDSQVGLALPWLVGLRWVAMVSQALLVLVLILFFHIPVPAPLIAIILGFSGLSNYYLHTRKESDTKVTNGLITAIISLDAILLTLLIFATGGALNPFTFLYLIHVVLGTIFLPQTGAWIIAIITILCYGSLFLPGIQTIGALTNHPPACHAQDDLTGTMRLHLQGMWIAYSFTVICVVFIVGKIQKALSLHRQINISLNDERRRNEMLASLATLAAGATHELSTPLSTIAVASGEMIDTLKENGDDGDLMEDVLLIRDQVRGCKEILFQMAADAGEHRGEDNKRFSCDQAVSAIIASLPTAQQGRVQVDNQVPDLILFMPQRTLCRSVAGLVNNGLEADNDDGPVTMAWLLDGDDLVIKVTDLGSGMDEETIGKAIEPFYTTRPNGLGLGLYLAGTMADRFGGSLEIESALDEGTTIVLRMIRARIS
ncbi:MAG: HAMP domain-containing histidine kinase [bacterium]|nr:HAMP domain-containing histidine kinase [bacterium]